MEPTGIIKTIRLKGEVVEAVKKIAISENRNFSNMIETILMAYLKQGTKS